MAVLTMQELASARRRAEGLNQNVTYTKAQINAALQAIEDTLMTTPIPQSAVDGTVRALVVANINAASAPFVFSAAEKKRLFAYWAERRFRADAV